jgi:membrane-bound metal-dependent hydrolase YbcI (DUF457 family)
MPTAVTHLLVPIFIASLFRDYLIKKSRKSKFPLHYVLFAGIGGVLPDVDILFYLIVKPLGYTLEQVHRQWIHSLFIPLLFIILALLFCKINFNPHRKHILNLGIICLMLSFGTFMHILLDGTISGEVHPFSPISNYKFGLNLVNYLPEHLSGIAIPLFEGILFLVWIVYLEWKHKISDFI